MRPRHLHRHPPSDDELEAGQNRAAAVAAEAGRLANQVAEADAALLDLQSEVALRREETNAALIEVQDARAAAATARVVADMRLARTQSANQHARAREALAAAVAAEQRAAQAQRGAAAYQFTMWRSTSETGR